MSDELEPFRRAAELGCEDFEAGDEVWLVMDVPDFHGEEQIGTMRWVVEVTKLTPRQARQAADVCECWWREQQKLSNNNQHKCGVFFDDMIDLCREFARKHGRQVATARMLKSWNEDAKDELVRAGQKIGALADSLAAKDAEIARLESENARLEIMAGEGKDALDRERSDKAELIKILQSTKDELLSARHSLDWTRAERGELVEALRRKLRHLIELVEALRKLRHLIPHQHCHTCEQVKLVVADALKKVGAE